MANSKSQQIQTLSINKILLWIIGVALVVTGTLLPARSLSVSSIACPIDPGVQIGNEYLAPRDGGRTHAGIDLGIGVGSPIYAAESGTVEDHWYQGYQNTKDLHGATTGRVYRYAHITQGGVSGQVSAGQNIGKSGNGNGAVDAHLHWEIRTDGGGFSGQDGRVGTIDPAPEYSSACLGANPTSTPPVGGNPAPDCHSQVLRRGASGECVSHLQNHLNEFGYGLYVDGDFGQNTQNAVNNFQSNRGLTVDGVVGPDTWAALHTPPQSPPPVSNPPATSPPPVFNPPTTPPAPVSTSGSRQIVGDGSGRCLDVSGESREKGAMIHIWECHGRANQQWKLLSDNSLQVYGSGGNMCLDIYGNNAENGASVTIWPCNGGANQRWYFPGDNTIRSQLNGKCLDVEGYGTWDGARVQMYDCYNTSNQLWLFR
jgi:hypothetical protein